MNRALIAALLSALVFPGAGHVYLKRRRRGLAFLVPALAALAYLMQRALGTASAVTDQVLDGRLPLDVGALATEVARQGAAQGNAVDIASAVLIVCWIGGIVDAWFLARGRRDR